MPRPYLNRTQAAEYLGELGLSIRPNTLKKLVVTGGGPQLYRFGRRALYRPEDLAGWFHDHVRSDGARRPTRLVDSARRPTLPEIPRREAR